MTVSLLAQQAVQGHLYPQLGCTAESPFPYSADMAPPDFFHFPKVIKMSWGCWSDRTVHIKSIWQQNRILPL